MKFIDFGVFQNFKQMLSHDKIIFHMLFGAFQITPRNRNILWQNYGLIHITRDPFGFSDPFNFLKRVEAAYAVLYIRYRLYPLTSVAYAA